MFLPGYRGVARYADGAVLDGELTLGLPQHVTAATGIDAMVCDPLSRLC